RRAGGGPAAGGRRAVRRPGRRRGEAPRGRRACLRPGGRVAQRPRPGRRGGGAVACGLPPWEGLKAVTVYPTRTPDAADRLGTIMAGKWANLVIAGGDVLQASTPVLAVFIDGKPYE